MFTWKTRCKSFDHKVYKSHNEQLLTGFSCNLLLLSELSCVYPPIQTGHNAKSVYPVNFLLFDPLEITVKLHFGSTSTLFLFANRFYIKSTLAKTPIRPCLDSSECEVSIQLYADFSKRATTFSNIHPTLN